MGSLHVSPSPDPTWIHKNPTDVTWREGTELYWRWFFSWRTPMPKTDSIP